MPLACEVNHERAVFLVRLVLYVCSLKHYFAILDLRRLDEGCDGIEYAVLVGCREHSHTVDVNAIATDRQG